MKLNENLKVTGKIIESNRTNLPKSVLCRVTYPICNIGKLNANNRVYERDVWEKVLSEKDITEKMKFRCLFGQAEHPTETQSDLQLTSHVIHEMHIDEDTVYQTMDVLDTPTGRIINTLLEAGCQVGVSTRAEGDLEEYEIKEDGAPKKCQKVVAETYRYVTTDFTADPSTFGVTPQNIEHNMKETVSALIKEGKMTLNEKKFATDMLNSVKCKECTCGKDCEVSKLIEELDEAQGKFMIHFQGADSSNELYDERGREIFDLETAKSEAERQFPKDAWEIYNGQESFNSPNWLEESDVPEQHQLKIAKKTLQMSDAGAKVMGGMTKEEARAFLKKIGWSESRIAKLEESKIQEGVHELIGETPGINNQDQEILNWALENEVITDEWPSEEDMVDALSALTSTDRKAKIALAGTKDLSGLDTGEIKAVYLKHILMPQAKQEYTAKNSVESKTNEAINVYKTMDGEITDLQEEDVEMRDGKLVCKKSGKPVILDQEKSGSAIDKDECKEAFDGDLRDKPTMVLVDGKPITGWIKNTDAKTIALMLSKAGMSDEERTTFKFQENESKINEMFPEDQVVTGILNQAGFKNKFRLLGDGSIKPYDEEDASYMVDALNQDETLMKNLPGSTAYYAEKDNEIVFAKKEVLNKDYPESFDPARESKSLEEKISEDIRRITPGIYKVMFFDKHQEEVEAESKVDAMKKAREKHPGSGISNTVMLSSTGYAHDVDEDIRRVSPGTFKVMYMDGTSEEIGAESKYDAKKQAEAKGKRVMNIVQIENTVEPHDVQFDNNESRIQILSEEIERVNPDDYVFAIEPSEYEAVEKAEPQRLPWEVYPTSEPHMLGVPGWYLLDKEFLFKIDKEGFIQAAEQSTIDKVKELLSLEKQYDQKPVDKKPTKLNFQKKESVQETASSLIDLKVQEAISRANFEVLQEQMDLDSDIRLANRVLVDKAKKFNLQLMEAIKEQTALDAESKSLCKMLEKKATEAHDLSKQLSEAKGQVAKLNDQLTDLKESVKQAKEEGILEGRNQLVKEYFETRLKESKLQTDENTRALLEDYQDLQEVESLMEKLVRIARRSALHSRSITEVKVPKTVIADSQDGKIDATVGNLMKRMN